MARALLDVFIQSYENSPEGVVIDLDDTADPTHGNQQLTFFNAYHDCHCYMPMHIYEGKSGKLITTILRPGKRPSGKEIVTILKRIIKMIHSAWPGVGIIIRGDSCYSATEVFTFCRENDLKFVFGYKAYDNLMQKSRNLVKVAKEYYHRY